VIPSFRFLMRSSLLAVLISLLVASATAAGWITLAPNLDPRQEVAIAAVGGRVYLIGGIRQGGPVGAESAATVEAYDPATNQWTTVAPLPEALHHSGAVAFEDQIYVFGGYRTIFFDSTDAAYRYDPRSNTWTTVAPMPQRRAAHAAAVIGNRIYVVGGAGPLTASLMAYQPSAAQWTTLAPMPTAREHLAAGVIGGKLYVAGGRIPSNLSMDTFEEYDPATDTWRILPPMPTGRSGIAAAVVEGRLYVFGGEGNRANPLGTYEQNESYDPSEQRWRTEQPMPTPRHGIGAAALGRIIYVPAGATLQGFGVTATHEAFIPPGPRVRAVRR